MVEFGGRLESGCWVESVGSSTLSLSANGQERTMKYYIPKLSQEELEQRYKNIKPLIMKDGNLYYIERPECLTSMSFLWNPRLKERVQDLESVTTIKTLHTYGHYALFKPSVKEVLAQIPDNLLGTVCAFYLRGPGEAGDLSVYKDELNAGFQVAFATLYKCSKTKKTVREEKK